MHICWRALLVTLNCLALSAVAATPEPVQLTNEWTVKVDTLIDSSPGVGRDGTIYVGSFDGRRWAFKSDGTRKWVFRAGREIWSSPAVTVEGTVYFGSRDTRLYAVGPDGKKQWDFATGGWVDSSPAIGA